MNIFCSTYAHQPFPLNDTIPQQVSDSLEIHYREQDTVKTFNSKTDWRTDTINGSNNKQLSKNPYISYLGFYKRVGSKMSFFRYDKGERYTGKIMDTLISEYPQVKYSNKPHAPIFVEVVFEVQCIDGMPQGKGTLTTVQNNQLLAQCFFENGEIIGECVSWDLYSRNEKRITYIKGSARFTKYVEMDSNGKIISIVENKNE